MGLDIGICAAKNEELLKSGYDNHLEYDEIKNNPHFKNEYGNFIWPDICEVWYARKFWDMVHAVPTLRNTENGEYSRIRREDLKQMIEFYAFNQDYFESFDGLPRLCELYRDYDELTAQNVKLWFWKSF